MALVEIKVPDIGDFNEVAVYAALFALLLGWRGLGRRGAGRTVVGEAAWEGFEMHMGRTTGEGLARRLRQGKLGCMR